jgi:hypothetical protein
VGVERIEDIKKRGRVWKGELERVGVEDFDVVAGVGGGLPLSKVFLSGGDQRGTEFDADDTAKRKIGGEHEGSAFAAADIDEDVIANGVGAASEGVVPEGENVDKCRGSGSPIGRDVAVVVAAGVETASADEPAGFDSVLEVERMDGELDWEGATIEMPGEGDGGLARTDLGEELAYVIDGVGCAHG